MEKNNPAPYGPPDENYAGRKILLLDFDGVLHRYRRGWSGPGNIDDVPVDGAQDFVLEAMKHFRVMVYSSRTYYENGLSAMKVWMSNWGFPEVEFPTEKPPAYVTIDDRAIQFKGVWPDIGSLINFKPWYGQDDL